MSSFHASCSPITLSILLLCSFPLHSQTSYFGFSHHACPERIFHLNPSSTLIRHLVLLLLFLKYVFTTTVYFTCVLLPPLLYVTLCSCFFFEIRVHLNHFHSCREIDHHLSCCISRLVVIPFHYVLIAYVSFSNMFIDICPDHHSLSSLGMRSTTSPRYVQNLSFSSMDIT